TAPGLLPATRDRLVVPPNGALTGIDLALDAGGVTVRGTVTDVGGGGIAGARVTLRRGSENPFLARADLVALAKSDGTYQLQVGDGTYEASASHEDYTRAEKQLQVAGAPVVADFILVPGGVIRGEVVARDGGPVPNAIVSAKPDREGGGGREPTTAVADDQGRFVMRGLPSGAIALTGSARRLGSKAPTVVELGIGEQVEVRITLDGAYTVSGRAVEKGKKDKGIPGIRMGLFSMDNASALAIDPTGDDGAFEILGVRPNTYFLFAIGDDRVPEIGTTIVEVKDRDVTDVVVEMASGVTLSGRVEPPAVATLTLDIDASKLGLGNMFEAIKPLFARAESSADGAFTMRNVPPGELTLVANVTDGSIGRLPIVVADKDQSGLVVKLAVRASLAGRVTDANGAAVAGVTVTAAGGESGGPVVGFRDTGHRAVTAADGSFKVVGLEGAQVSLTVDDDHGPLAWADAAKGRAPIAFELEPGKARTGVQLVVEARDAWIRGTVLGPDKRPIADAWVRARYTPNGKDDDGGGDAGDTTPVLSGADGKFALERLRKGTYALVAEGPRGASRVAKSGVRTGETVTLQLEPLGTLTGKVADGTRPIGTYDLSCKQGAHAFHKHVVAADGAYQLERLPPGAYACEVTSDAGTAEGKVDVPSGSATLDFAIVPWATIVGTVANTETGAPVAGLSVLAGSELFASRSMADLLTGRGPTTDAAGRFTIPHVATGKGKVAVLSKTGGFDPLAQRDYEVTAGQRLDIGTLEVIPPRSDGGTLGLTTAVTDVPDASTHRLVVASVAPGGPAEAAGVKAGDHVVSIDGRPVADPEAAQQALAAGAVAIGQVVRLGLDRTGAPVQAAVTAAKW
ncbi:MAG: carboxypeptidase regulatory-like domain-containing protein, partial [Deltaproteobacteria bacterium]|nr:carboxypeptidase regulatory-like domain-containing protein [Deltaproteobacteria bacterium]